MVISVWCPHTSLKFFGIKYILAFIMPRQIAKFERNLTDFVVFLS